jgi:hypothetical protein
MTDDEFWELIADARPVNDDDWSAALVERLTALPEDEIAVFSQILDRMVDDAYRWDVWGAAYFINGGCSDDGFYYFRGWLIGQGRQVYESALLAPDTLADHDLVRAIINEGDAECESIHQAAMTAYEKKTGRQAPPFPRRPWPAEPAGESWNFDDPDELRRRLPRLSLVDS